MTITENKLKTDITIVIEDGTVVEVWQQNHIEVMKDGVRISKHTEDSETDLATLIANKTLPNEVALAAQLGAMTTERDALQARVNVLTVGNFKVLSREQFVAATKAAGVYNSITMAIAGAGAEAVAAWDAASLFHRDNELIIQLAQAIGLTENAVDALWRQAETL